MENKGNKPFDNIIECLRNENLSASLRAVRSFMDMNPNLTSVDEFGNIERDYRLMLDFMKRGYADPERESIYGKLLVRLCRFVCDLQLAYNIRHLSFYTEASRKSAGRQFTPDGIRSNLENFVTDMAMLSLEVEEVREAKGKETHRRHYEYMQQLFNHIVVMGQWTQDESSFYQNLLLSPTIDGNDAQMMVSAIMLATMNCFDPNKLLTLLNTYQKSTDEKVRQKALVGFVFSLPTDIPLQGEAKNVVVGALADDKMVSEMTDLQKQIVFCLNAEKDKDTIQKDIIPEIIKHNNLNITRFGITEKEEDPMTDVFDPGASDRAMEKMEESFQKMMNMQKAGSDVYFGGFSQMKRFPFFYNLSNWFSPFYIEHPDISAAAEKLKGTPLLENILNNGPFCDSDKYSFTLALSSVISHLPSNMREMFNSKEALGNAVSDKEAKNPTYIRRMILQDLYRFYRLFSQREQLVNPFSDDRFTFVTNEALLETPMKKSYQELACFMIKHKNKVALDHIMGEYIVDKDPKCMLLQGIYKLDFLHDTTLALLYLEELRTLEPDNKRGLMLLARTYFEDYKYKEAAECYKRIIELDPKNKIASLNYCIALVKDDNYDEAIKPLYKLDFESPNTPSVKRVLAWTLMGQVKLEQAEAEYEWLLGCNDVETGDWLNAGYCQWLMGNTANAVTMFEEFHKRSKAADRSKAFEEALTEQDKTFLERLGITEVDIKLMLDIITA